METSSLSRAATPLAAPTPKPSAQGLSTDVPAPKVVPPSVDVSLSPEADRKRRAEIEQRAQQDRRRGFVTSPNSDDLVFRVADGSSGTIVFQLPSEEMLKLRAYAEQAERARSERDATVDSGNRDVTI